MPGTCAAKFSKNIEKSGVTQSKKNKTPTQLRDFKSLVLGRVTKADKSQSGGCVHSLD